jgi:endo-1,4-beta-xylanase
MKKILSTFLSLALVLSLLTFAPAKVDAASVPSNANLLNTYGSLFGHVGTCVTPNQWNDSNTRNFIKGQYNSITMENEMKPDAVLRNNTMSVSQAKGQGYNIPSNYSESTVPTLNFSTIDSMMKNAYDNGIQIRYHVLVWHSQTPDWFFRSGYSSNGGYVSKSQMNARMEFYIRSIMDHVYNSRYGNVVYCWDVVNEYMHASNSGWLNIYGAVNTRPDFVKLAFQIAHDELVKFNKQNSVSLFYNDYNTYMECDKIISMVNWINSNGKICSGVGMQSHLSSSFPSPDYFNQALTKFLAQGYEVQITELDAKGNNDSDQANYYKQIMTNILNAKKKGGNITAVIWWGLHDGASWRRGENPLLFSSLGVKKQSYNAVLQAYFDAGFSIGQVTAPSSAPAVSTQPQVSVAPTQVVPSTGKITDGTYYIKNVNAQKYLQVAGNTGADAQNVELGTGTGVAGQKWTVTNNSDGTVTLKSGLGNFSLDVANAADEDGANVQIYSSWDGDAQKFIIKETSTDGIYQIATKASNGTKNLDGSNYGKEDGTNIQQWSNTTNTNQQWIFEKVGGSTSASTAPASKAPVTVSQAPSAAPSQAAQTGGNATDIAKSYMAKLNVVNTCPSGADQKKGGVQYGSTTKKTYYSTTTGGNRKCNVILPANYSSSKKYPVMYVLHGIGGNEDSMIGDNIVAIPANLAAQGKAKEFIIVCPDQYAPAPGTATSFAFNQAYFDGYDNFINDLTKDLMPYIEKNYSVATGRENTAICGFSMGGRNALYIGYARPDLFGYVGAFSPAPGVTPGNDFSGMHKGLFSESDFRIKDERYVPYVTLIACGTNDSVVGTFPKSYHEILTRNNQPHVWFEVPGADHDNNAINAGYYNFCSAAFGVLGLNNTQTSPSAAPSVAPSAAPSVAPSIAPSAAPSIAPSVAPSEAPAAAGVTCDYKVTSDWGSGWQAEITITNKSGKTLNGWTLTFDYNSEVVNGWGADFVGQSGKTVTVKNPSWDANLANGQSVTVCFIANGSDKSAPTNVVVK